MIRIENSVFKTSEDATTGIFIRDALFLFITVSLSGMGTANVVASWAHTLEGAKTGEQFTLPNQTAAAMEGGTGTTRYDQMIDRIETLVINYLSAFNPGCTFTKIR